MKPDTLFAIVIIFLITVISLMVVGGDQPKNQFKYRIDHERQ